MKHVFLFSKMLFKTLTTSKYFSTALALMQSAELYVTKAN